jgi:hypothetical protein
MMSLYQDNKLLELFKQLDKKLDKEKLDKLLALDC